MLGPLALQLAGNPLEYRHGLGRHCDPALTSEPDGFISIPKEAWVRLTHPAVTLPNHPMRFLQHEGELGKSKAAPKAHSFWLCEVSGTGIRELAPSVCLLYSGAPESPWANSWTPGGASEESYDRSKKQRWHCKDRSAEDPGKSHRLHDAYRTQVALNQMQMCAKKAQPQAHVGLIQYSPYTDTAAYVSVCLKILLLTLD